MADVTSPPLRDDDFVNPSYLVDYGDSPPQRRKEHTNDVDLNDNEKSPQTSIKPTDFAKRYPDPLDNVTSDRAGLYSADATAFDDDYGVSSSDDERGDIRNKTEPAVLKVSAQDELSNSRLGVGFAPSALGVALDSLVLEQPGRSDQAVTPGAANQGLDNEAYDGDEETVTDLSFQNNSFHANDAPFVISVPDPPAPDRHTRPSSGHYHKNPALERKRPTSLMTQGPYDPNNRVFLSPLPLKSPVTPEEGPQRRRRIPRPPSKLKLKCAFIWSCFACLVGNFLCAIPALRYFVTAKESSKIGDYNSAHSYLKKAAILAAVAIALAAAGWTILILYLTHAAFR